MDFTFLAAVVQLVGEQVRREQLGHLVKPHHTANFQLVWSDGDTGWDTHRRSHFKIWGCTWLVQDKNSSCIKVTINLQLVLVSLALCNKEIKGGIIDHPLSICSSGSRTAGVWSGVGQSYTSIHALSLMPGPRRLHERDGSRSNRVETYQTIIKGLNTKKGWLIKHFVTSRIFWSCLRP